MSSCIKPGAKNPLHKSTCKKTHKKKQYMKICISRMPCGHLTELATNHG
jgi:hypothetical protein